MESNELQLSKIRSPMAVMVDGRVTECSELQPEKTLSPIVVTEFGIMMHLREQPEKTSLPMVVTVFGIVISLREVQFINALSSINVTVVSTTTLVTWRRPPPVSQRYTLSAFHCSSFLFGWNILMIYIILRRYINVAQRYTSSESLWSSIVFDSHIMMMYFMIYDG